MAPSLLLAVVGGLVLLLLLVVAALLAKRCYVAVPSGFALIVTRPSGAVVTYSGALVLPGIQKAELMDLRTHVLERRRLSESPVVTKDRVPLVARVSYHLRVHKEPSDVLKVAQALGVERANDPAYLDRHFGPKIEAALEYVASTLDGDEMLTKRGLVIDEMARWIGADLGGFVLDDLTVVELARVHAD
jgi:uncharacterized membrane protein YqiK